MFCKECGKQSDRSFSGLCQACYNYFVRDGGTVHDLPSPGIVAADENGKIICHICGRSYKRLGSHIRESHNMTIAEYKERFDLCRNARTTEENYHQKMHRHACENGMPERIIEIGMETRIKKGETDKRKGKTVRKQEIRERAERVHKHYQKENEPMKRIINGKLYNTETAKKVGEWSNNLSYSDHTYCEEALYRKITGEFFLYGKSGAAGRYSKYYGNMRGSGEDIIPLTESEAKKWTENHLDAERYIELFGEPEEQESISEVLMKILKGNEDNRPTVSEEGYPRGYYEGVHDAIVDVLNALHIEHSEKYYND